MVSLHAILTETTKRQNFFECSPERKRSNALRIRRAFFYLSYLFLPAFLIECFKSCVLIDRNFLYVKIPLLLRSCHNSYEQSLGQHVLFQIKSLVTYIRLSLYCDISIMELYPRFGNYKSQIRYFYSSVFTAEPNQRTKNRT